MKKAAQDVLLSAAHVLTIEAQALTDAAQRLQSDETSRAGFQKALELFLHTQDKGGKIVVTGVGKSGKIGEKIVATMLSTGTYAVFLHPVDALHGDLGIVQPQDAVLALSYSGHTDELLLLLPNLRRIGVPVVGLGGNPKSKLALDCAAWIDGFVGQEVGGRDIPAPTSSTTLALALGDALALSLAKLRTFSSEAFARNHPSGSLGRRLLLQVQDVMIPSCDVASVAMTHPLDQVISKMMDNHRGGCTIILQSSHDPTVRGVIKPKDIQQFLQSRPIHLSHLTAQDVMSLHFSVCHQDDLASKVEKRMQDDPSDLLPPMIVLDKDEQWKGVVTLDCLRNLF